MYFNKILTQKIVIIFYIVFPKKKFKKQFHRLLIPSECITCI